MDLEVTIFYLMLNQGQVHTNLNLEWSGSMGATISLRGETECYLFWIYYT